MLLRRRKRLLWPRVRRWMRRRMQQRMRRRHDLDHPAFMLVPSKKLQGVIITPWFFSPGFPFAGEQEARKSFLLPSFFSHYSGFLFFLHIPHQFHILHSHLSPNGFPLFMPLPWIIVRFRLLHLQYMRNDPALRRFPLSNKTAYTSPNAKKAGLL